MWSSLGLLALLKPAEWSFGPGHKESLLCSEPWRFWAWKFRWLWICTGHWRVESAPELLKGPFSWPHKWIWRSFFFLLVLMQDYIKCSKNIYLVNFQSKMACFPQSWATPLFWTCLNRVSSCFVPNSLWNQLNWRQKLRREEKCWWKFKKKKKEERKSFIGARLKGS